MNPVIICGTFERLPRVDGFIQLLLLLAEVIGDLLSVFALYSITLAVLLGFFLVRQLGRLNKVLFGVLYRAEFAFILLQKLAEAPCENQVLLTMDT